MMNLDYFIDLLVDKAEGFKMISFNFEINSNVNKELFIIITNCRKIFLLVKSKRVSEIAELLGIHDFHKGACSGFETSSLNPTPRLDKE